MFNIALVFIIVVSLLYWMFRDSADCGWGVGLIAGGLLWFVTKNFLSSFLIAYILGYLVYIVIDGVNNDITEYKKARQDGKSRIRAGLDVLKKGFTPTDGAKK